MLESPRSASSQREDKPGKAAEDEPDEVAAETTTVPLHRGVPAHLYISPPPWLEEDRESESQFVTDPVIDPGTGREAIEATTSGPAEGSSDSAAPPGGRTLYPEPSTGRLLDLSLDDDDFMPELTSGSGDNSSEDSFMACLDYGFEGGTKD